MNVIVTGARGFIGSHVCRLLAGHDVIEVDCMEPRVHGPCSMMGRPACELTGSELAEADVLIHLAAQVGIADSMADPVRYVGANTWDTARMLAEVPEGLKIVVASSMSVYGDPRIRDPVPETHPVAPASVYGLTKYDQERLCRLLCPQTIALRFFNVYGPGQCLTNPYTGVLAIFATALMNDEAPTVYEDGLQTRDFVYVEDVAEAVVRCALEDVPPDVYNVCTGLPTAILEAAHALRAGLGGQRPHVTHDARAGDVRHCIGDPSKLQRVLDGWRARPFHAGVGEYLTGLVT